MRKITADISENTATNLDEFTNGDPQNSVPATILPAEWLNTIQRELVTLIEAAGLSVNPANDTQILAAINALVGGPVYKIYDAIVGTGIGATHSTLAAAIAAVPAGATILVTTNQTVDTSIAVNKANLKIEFKPGVTFSKGTATKGLVISASGVRIIGARLSGFSTSGDKAIEIQAGADYCVIGECRFASNDITVDDIPGTSAIYGSVEE